jgi:two-component system, chemotaxis family, CheB/CheR fusion protein
MRNSRKVSIAVIDPSWLTAVEAMGRPLRLLLVEDHVDSAELLAEMLSNHGHTVAIATCVSEALALARAQEFDVVVSDVGLPDASGYDLMQQIRSLYTMKGIAVTGSSRAGDIERGREAGFSMHLIKPVSLRRLEAALEQVTGP